MLGKLLASLALTTSLLATADARSFARPPGAPSAPVQRPAIVDHDAELPVPDIHMVSPSRAKVRAALAARRKVTLARFVQYRDARVYPVNATPGTAHIWIDAAGRLCAAATLIAADWGMDVARNIGAWNNAVALADITAGELHDWILTSGLTQGELVAIQVPMIGPMNPPTVVDESERLFAIYTDVLRQVRGLERHNLDLATDALMQRPELAKRLVAGEIAQPRKFTSDRDVERFTR